MLTRKLKFVYYVFKAIPVIFVTAQDRDKDGFIMMLLTHNSFILSLPLGKVGDLYFAIKFYITS